MADDIKAEEESLRGKFKSWAQGMGLIKADAANDESGDTNADANTDQAALASMTARAEKAESELALAQNFNTALTAVAGTAATTLADFEALLRDGMTARTDAAAELAKNINRVLGVGTTTQEAVAAKFAGKTLAEFKTETAPYNEAANQRFNPAASKADGKTDAKTDGKTNNTADTGRQTLDGETNGEAALAAIGKMDDAALAKIRQQLSVIVTG